MKTLLTLLLITASAHAQSAQCKQAIQRLAYADRDISRMYNVAATPPVDPAEINPLLKLAKQYSKLTHTVILNGSEDICRVVNDSFPAHKHILTDDDQLNYFGQLMVIANLPYAEEK